MGATYTRQSVFTDGDVIDSDIFNNEFDQLLAAFASSTGHTHDGTAGEGGPITGLITDGIVFGTNTGDITLTWNGGSNDGLITWKEDEDYFEFNDDLLIATTEKIQFRDTGIYINSSADGQLDLVADTEIQIAATTIDINGNVNVSGTLTIGGAGISEAELEILDGATVTTDELNILDGVTATASEINTLDGITSTVAELNILDGVTSTAAELNILDGVTSTATELNILDGVTATTAELNILDGKAFLDEDNLASDSATGIASQQSIKAYVDGITTTNITSTGALNSGSITSGFGNINNGSSTITTTGAISGGSFVIGSADINENDLESIDGITAGTVAASKAVVVDANKDATGFRNITLTGELDAGSLDVSGNVDVDGTLETDALSINGTAVTSTATELNILDGVTSTTAELNILDGVTSTAAELNILDGKAFLDEDNFGSNSATGIASQQSIKAYVDGITATNITSTGALNSGSITSGFGNIDTGSSTITTTGLISGGSLDIDNVLINGTTIGHTDDTDLITLADGVVTVAGEVSMTTLDIGGTNVTSTAAELNALDGITAVVGELNALDLGSTATGTAIASKAVVIDANKDYTGIRNFSITGNLSVGGTTTVVDTVTMNAQNAVLFEGATADAHETTLTIVDPTADRTINLPNQSGTVPVLAAASNTAITSTPEELNILDGVTATTAELNILDASNSTLGDLSEISSVANDDVFLAIDTSGGGLKKVTRSTIVSGLATSSALSNVVEDTTPQLGGNLDVLARSITTSTTNGNIALTPNGSGVVMIDGNVGIDTGKIDLKNGGTASQILFYCESSNAHAQTLQGAPHSQGATNTLLLPDGGNGTLLSTVSVATLTNKTLTSPKINEDVAVTSTATELNLLDGVTATTAELNILDGVTSTAAELNILDGVTTTAAEINLIDGGTARGTTAVADGDGVLINDGGTMRMTKVDTLSTYMSGKSVGGANIVTTGALNSGTITSGFGTIDTGSSTITTTGTVATGAITAGGVVTANAGVVVDNFTLDGTTLALSSGDLTLDAANNIFLDADGGVISLKDGGTSYGQLIKSSNDFRIFNPISDGDIVFRGNDGGSTITALTLDMSEAGAATFNNKIIATELDISGNADIDGTLEADAITVNGTALAEVISDTVGAMVSSNTESGITVTYQDADNTLDFTVGTLNQNTTGSAATLTTARAIAVAGDVTGTANFDGSAGISITTTLATDAIVTANITDGNVTVAKMAANSIDSAQYVDGSIDTAHIADGQITNAKLGADSVNGAKIGDNVLDSEHYAAGSIDTEHIADGQITNAKLGADSVNGAKIGDNVINSEHYVDGSIDREHLAADIIDGTKIADNAINSEHYADGSIDRAHLAADIIDGTKIADDAINSEHYAAGSIDAEHLASDSVTEAKMAANSVDSQAYVDGSIDQVHLANAIVNEAKMQISNAPTNGYFLSAQSGNTGGLTWAEAGGGASVQTFTSSGTWNKPSSGTVAMITCIGGGGGGGAMNANIGGGHGKGGQHAVKFILLSALGSSATVTIGAAGAGAPNSSTAGGLGGDTTFADYVISLGGQGGQSYQSAWYEPALGSRTSFAANSYGSYIAGNSSLSSIPTSTSADKMINGDSDSVDAVRNRTGSNFTKAFNGKVYGRSGGTGIDGDITDIDAAGYGAGGGPGYQVAEGGDGSVGFCSVIVF